MQVWLPPGFGLGAGAGAGGAGGPGGAGGVGAGAGAGPPPVQGQEGLPHLGQGWLPGHISGGFAAGLQSTTGGGATGDAEAAESSSRSAAHAIAGWLLSTTLLLRSRSLDLESVRLRTRDSKAKMEYSEKFWNFLCLQRPARNRTFACPRDRHQVPGFWA